MYYMKIRRKVSLPVFFLVLLCKQSEFLFGEEILEIIIMYLKGTYFIFNLETFFWKRRLLMQNTDFNFDTESSGRRNEIWHNFSFKVCNLWHQSARE